MRPLGHQLPVLSGLLVLVLATSAPRASAQPAALTEIYEEAKSELDAERYDAAARAFSEGYARAPAGPMRWRMALGLALSHELAGDLARAAEYYILFLDLSRGDPAAQEGKWAERRRRAQRDREALIERLGPSHAQLRLETTPPQAEVVIDDGEAALQKTPATFVLPVGEHRVSLQHDDHLPHEMSLTLKPGERMRMQRVLRPIPVPAEPKSSAREAEKVAEPSTAPPAPDSVEDESAAASTDARVRTFAGYGALGLGGASLVLAGVFTGMTASTVGELNDLAELETVTNEDLARDRELRDRLAWQRPSYVTLYAVGGLATATGLVLLLWPSDEVTAADLWLRLAPTGAAVSGRF